MCESYARSLLRVSVAQICQALGWDAVQLTAADLLSDVLHRYIQQLARGCRRYSELYGRTDPMLDDVGQAFRLLGVNLAELEDYVHNLEPVGFAHQTPLFPVSKNNMLQFPQPGTRDTEERMEHIPDYMPPLVSLQEEEEEEEVLADMGTSAEAMQVPLDEEDEEEEELEDEEGVNDENHPMKRPMSSPDASTGMMPSAKRPRFHSSFSPEWSGEPREPLSSLNPQRVPSSMMDSIGFFASSPEAPVGQNAGFRPLPVTPRLPEHKASSAQDRKPKVSSPGRQRTKSPKGASGGPLPGSPICSPKALQKEKKKSPGRAKSPKSPKSPKPGLVKMGHIPGKSEPLPRTPLATLSERMGKENVHVRQQGLDPDKQPAEAHLRKAEPPDNTIDDSIDAVIAKACAQREPDPFAYTSASESESDGFSSPRRLTIMEPATPKSTLAATNSHDRDTSTPFSMNAGNTWSLDDSIKEVIRKVNQGGPPETQPNTSYLSSPSASPPTPEPLIKVFEEKNKMVASADVKKKLKKELKSKLKKKEKPKEKEKDRDKGKMKEKNRDKNRDKDFTKDGKMPWKDFAVNDEDLRDHIRIREFGPPEASLKSKSKDGVDGASRKEKDKHKDKKKDKEKSRKDKEKRDKGKERGKEERKISAALTPFALAPDIPAPLLGPAAVFRMSSMLPPLPPILPDKDVKSKEKDKKKDKKDKKKKKEKERDRMKEKDREKEEKRKEKEREKEKREKEKEKELEPPVALPSPVIPRLTLRVGAGQDKIVISKVVPNADAPKTPISKPPPPCAPLLPPVIPHLTSPAPLPPPAAPPAPAPPPAPVLALGSSVKTPVRSVVTETVSTYVIRDEWGNKIWICPGCNKADDGSPMIGCDDCDDWYHWTCVGLTAAPPEDVQWFCVKCAVKKKDKKSKKRKNKAH
uniref:Transcription initiation factor TFIID subunit 3 n=1 Tax=Denticeps clupeoides TaxID=299321 RepID=A0AAY4BMT9_9TELE